MKKKFLMAVMAVITLTMTLAFQAGRQEVFAANGDKEWESISYGGRIYALAVDDNYVYVSGLAHTEVWALDKTDGSVEWESISYGVGVYALAVDEGPKFAPKATAMQAEKHGNAFRLSGVKAFVADGATAGRVLVLARTAGSAGDHEGLTLFDIDANRAGLDREQLSTIDSRDHARLIFDGVEATGDDIIGDLDHGLAALRPGLQAGQAALAAELTGLASGASAITLGYLKERKQFDRTIGSFQALQHRAAHLWSEIEVTASAIANAGRVLDHTPEDAELAVSLAKARAAQTAKLAVSEAVQMHGGIGMTDAYDIGFFMKRARVGAEWLGDYGYHAAVIAAARGF